MEHRRNRRPWREIADGESARIRRSDGGRRRAKRRTSLGVRTDGRPETPRRMQGELFPDRSDRCPLGLARRIFGELAEARRDAGDPFARIETEALERVVGSHD